MDGATSPSPIDDRPAWEEFTAARDRFFTLLSDLAELSERAEVGDQPTGPHREGPARVGRQTPRRRVSSRPMGGLRLPLALARRPGAGRASPA